ncbi:MAG: hypothetical protein IKB30_02315 [Clostridia bacterium]|nr:hypothetical protein [Clostridia bacterium]
MRERAKQALQRLKEKNKEVEKEFNEYVELLEKELEIPKEIATNLVADELVNRYKKELILHSIFSKMTLDKYSEVIKNGGADKD